MKLKFFNVFTEDLAAGRRRLADERLTIYVTAAVPDPVQRTKADLPELAIGNGYEGPIDAENMIEVDGAIAYVRGIKSVVVTATGPLGPVRALAMAGEDDGLIGWWDVEETTLENNETFIMDLDGALLEIGT